MKKMIISALIASMIAMSAMTGCGSSSAKPQEEVKEAVQEEQLQEQTEDVRDAEAPEASTADAAAPNPATEDHAAAEMTAGPIETEEVSVFGTETAAETDEPGSVYPEFHYTGEDPYLETIWVYFQENYGQYYEKTDISVPSFLILDEDDSDPDDIKVWGVFSLFNYDVEGKTLLNLSGGDYPGLVHLKADGDSFEVTGIDLVEDGMDYSSSVNQIFGEKEGLAEKFWNSDEKQEEARADFLKMYIRDNNLDIDAYQDYGWDPVPLK